MTNRRTKPIEIYTQPLEIQGDHRDGVVQSLGHKGAHSDSTRAGFGMKSQKVSFDRLL